MRPAAVSASPRLQDQLAGHHVEPGDRLVQQQQLGLLGQALGHQDPLALAAGQLVQLAAGQVGDLQAVERLLHRRPVGGPQPPEGARGWRSGPWSRSPAR